MAKTTLGAARERHAQKGMVAVATHDTLAQQNWGSEGYSVLHPIAGSAINSLRLPGVTVVRA